MSLFKPVEMLETFIFTLQITPFLLHPVHTKSHLVESSSFDVKCTYRLSKKKPLIEWNSLKEFSDGGRNLPRNASTTLQCLVTISTTRKGMRCHRSSDKDLIPFEYSEKV